MREDRMTLETLDIQYCGRPWFGVRNRKFESDLALGALCGDVRGEGAGVDHGDGWVRGAHLGIRAIMWPIWREYVTVRGQWLGTCGE